MSGGGTESYSGPSKKVKKSIDNNLLPDLEGFSNQFGADDLYSGTRLGELDENVTAGQDLALDLAGRYNQQYQGVTDSLEGFLNYNPNSPQNVAAREALNANVQAAFDETIRPGIEDRGTFSGQFGGPQQSIALGSATAPLSRALADAEVGLMNADRDRAMRAMGMAPSLLSGQFLGADVMTGVGNQRTGREQLELNDYIQEMESPYNNALRQLTDRTNLYGGLSSATQHSSQQSGGFDPLQAATGLGMAYLGGGGTIPLGALLGLGGAAAATEGAGEE